MAAGLVLVAVVAAIFTGRALHGDDEVPTVTTCNGHRELCNRRVDDVSFASSHNAMSAATEPGWLFATHEKGIRRQLDDGVRGLLIDTHYGVKTDKGVATDLEAGQQEPGQDRGRGGRRSSWTRPSACAGGWATSRARASARSSCATPTARSGRRRQRTALEEIRDFVIENPGEVVVLSIEDDVSPEDTAKIFKDSGLLDYVYDGPMGPRMPTLRQLIDRGQPVLVYSENKTDRKYPWLPPAVRLRAGDAVRLQDDRLAAAAGELQADAGPQEQPAVPAQQLGGDRTGAQAVEREGGQRAQAAARTGAGVRDASGA